MTQANGDCLFETSFEVCNKIGGIHTVISSKAALMKRQYKEYYLIGPLFPNTQIVEFSPEEMPRKFRTAIETLQQNNIRCQFGRWLIKGEPFVFLLDFSAFEKKNDYKKLFWDKFGVDSLFGGFEFDEPVTFAVAAGMLIDCISKTPEYMHKQIISHAHEWMSGCANLYLKSQGSAVKTVFTTHATMLGRAMSGGGKNMYELLESIEPEKEARSFNVYEKFSCEKACAQNADVFTTVSEVTAKECEKVLGRKPEVILHNGLDMNQFPSFEQISQVHASSKHKLKEFFHYFFFPYHNFNLDNSYIFFVSGRYEITNKGIDLTIKALGELNKRLQAEHSNKTAICIFWIPYKNFGIKKELLENKLLFKHIEQYIRHSQQNIHDKIIEQIITKKTLIHEHVFTEEFIQEIERMVVTFKRTSSIAPLCTHYLEDEDSNEIIRAFKDADLRNRPEDKVKVVFDPIYLTSIAGLLEMNYYDAIAGCQLGLFASWYEPWGYTPHEGAAMGIPVITTNASGFGQFMTSKIRSEGIFILDRMKNREPIQTYVELINNYIQLSYHERVKHKVQAKLLSEYADWKELIVNYIDAHNLALSK